MNRQIAWESCFHDEIELVYEKAARNGTAAGILEQLEAGALEEAKAHCGLLVEHDAPVTPERYAQLPSEVHERLMGELGRMGLAGADIRHDEPIIAMKLSECFSQVRCCTAFTILNFLEKLDGSYNVLHPQATLELRIPLGARRGLGSMVMLICLLYPWLSVNEIPDSTAVLPQQAVQRDHAGQPAVPASTPTHSGSKQKQPGLLARLFGK